MSIKKPIQKRLDKIAKGLPLVFNEHFDTVVMTTEELRLTPLANEMVLEPGKSYDIPIPKFVAVFHDQQVKDAFKRGGAKEVNKYVDSVISNQDGEYSFINDPITGYGQFIKT